MEIIARAFFGAIVWALIALRAAGGPGQLIPHDDPEAVARGAPLYELHCASCHGAALEGQENWRGTDADGLRPAPPHDETGHTWHHPDAQLFLITKYGLAQLVGGDYKTNMGGYSEVLTDQQILDTLAYIKANWPRRIIAQHDRINAQAAQ